MLSVIFWHVKLWKILALKLLKFLWFSKKKTLFYKKLKIWITLLQAIWCVLSKYDSLWCFLDPIVHTIYNMSWWNGFSGIWFFRLTYDIEININFFCNGVPYFIIVALFYSKGDLHHSPSSYVRQLNGIIFY